MLNIRIPNESSAFPLLLYTKNHLFSQIYLLPPSRETDDKHGFASYRYPVHTYGCENKLHQ
jgi:hypothetical protein